MTKLIDLSVTISVKGHLKTMPKITYWNHEQTVGLYGGKLNLEVSDFREGKFVATEDITLSTHQGTHLDAPWHYYPTSEGKPAKTIYQVPLEWCYSDGVLLDFHHKERGAGISAEEIQEGLKKIGYQLKPFDIVLIRTDATIYYGQPNYEYLGVGVTAEATGWLINQGIKVTGIDSFTWDRPFDMVLTRSGKRYWPVPASLPGSEKNVLASTPKSEKLDEFLESHLLGKAREYCHCENLVNLDKIPVPFGFKVSILPIKIDGASGSWARAVAILED